MAGQPPLSPWMNQDYDKPNWEISNSRDKAWLRNDERIELSDVYWKEEADSSIRMIDHWDNFDGTVERGYSGRSIFFEEGKFREDWGVIEDYARLLASIRINAIAINNVNVRDGACWFLSNKYGYLDKIKIINDIFAKYHIKTFISVNFAAPKIVGGLGTNDPLNPDVQDFWSKCSEEIYSIIPDFGGYVIKADAEGEPGPLQYGRTHSEGANMLGKTLAGYGGVVIWRCFVYNHKQDWRDRKTDRGKAAYEIFYPQDGKFDDNVILQIKNGPIDFQIKEPVSPLFGALNKTNQIIEFQLTQEYLGQQQHVVYEGDIFKEVLNWDVENGGYKECRSDTRVSKVIKENSVVSQNSGIAAVGNIGLDNNWTGNKLAQVNLYAYGRLAWDTSLSSEQIVREFIDLSFNVDDEAKEILVNIIMTSRDTYRNYTVPLGLGFMCRPGHHYGVDVDGYEYDAWGTYHFADRNGLGVDRTKDTGSNYVSQYSQRVCEMYNNLSTCPDEDLLFFHHVPYTHILKSGKTVIQHIYDTHFKGVEIVEKYIKDIKKIETQLSQTDYENIYSRLQEQLRQAIQWRDVINTYFLRHSGVEDEFSKSLERNIFK